MSDYAFSWHLPLGLHILSEAWSCGARECSLCTWMFAASRNTQLYPQCCWEPCACLTPFSVYLNSTFHLSTFSCAFPLLFHPDTTENLRKLPRFSALICATLLVTCCFNLQTAWDKRLISHLLMGRAGRILKWAFYFSVNFKLNSGALRERNCIYFRAVTCGFLIKTGMEGRSFLFTDPAVLKDGFYWCLSKEGGLLQVKCFSKAVHSQLLSATKIC